MFEFEDKEVIDALIKNKPGVGNIDKPKNDNYKPDEIVMVVDRSGSMNSIKEDAEGGINNFIDENKKEGSAIFTMVEFDSEYDVLCSNAPLEEIQRYNLRPRGSTALMDAIGNAFADVDEGNKDDIHSKIGVIVTDGGENASKEWTRDQIFKRIEELKEKGWEFIFLAANQDALKSGRSYGFNAYTTLNFNKNSVQSVYSAASAYSVSHRSGRGRDLSMKRAMASNAMKSVVTEDEVLASINTHNTSDEDLKFDKDSLNDIAKNLKE